VIGICVMISVSITFPLVVRILTKMGESTVSLLNKNLVTRLIWRTVMVCTCIGAGLILGSLNLFNPAIGMVAALIMVPIQMMVPCIMFFCVEHQDGKAKENVGIFNMVLIVIVNVCSLMFLGTGVYGSLMGFIKSGQ
jgi:hypothetical protein